MEAKNYSSILRKFSSKPPPSRSRRELSFQQVDSSSRTHASSRRASRRTSLKLSPPPSSPEDSSLSRLGKTPDRDVSPLSLPSQLEVVKKPASTPTVLNNTAPPPLLNPHTAAPHTNFKQILIHTAKCDKCNNHNKAILRRCTTCGFQICTPCWVNRGGGQHTATRVFRGPVFNPNAANDEEVDQGDEGGDNEEDEVGDGSISASDDSDDVGDAIVVSDNEKEGGVLSIHSVDEPEPPPRPPNLRHNDLDIPYHDPQTGEVSRPMYAYSSDPQATNSEDTNGANELPVNKRTRARSITRRYTRGTPSNQARKDTSDDESLVEITCEPARGKIKDRGGLYYSDLTPESRERIDILISTAINLFQGASFNSSQSQATHPPTSNNYPLRTNSPPINSRSPLFVPMEPNDHPATAYNARLSHAGTPRGSPRTSHRRPFHMPHGKGMGDKRQTTRQSRPPAPNPPARKRKRDSGDVERRERIWRGPFLDESSDEEKGTRGL
ncbi:hypothetical protein RJZ56_007062 [Blastomyces dermatitidis]|uniref:Uncharacterized protein n=1 Tax=Ajellomyces dermatitidis (strain ER-3 / ATCC MYA-2586) TaxID=559297 RepID=A0ABP2F6A8_AJEDR|nr:uncharacterized protein BDCG_07763 [Blastomyces dermatitidis ER-3]EEQ92643.1 hypothetical protein BDCG_07763 [Blastomyces dermatitidis ER-3]